MFKAIAEEVRIVDFASFIEGPAIEHLSVKAGFVVFLTKFKAMFFHLSDQLHYSHCLSRPE